MKVVIAPDKFKDCLSAAEVARYLAEGVRSVAADAQVDECPLADGGEGTVAALVAAMKGRVVTRRVTGPLADTRVDAMVGFLAEGATVGEANVDGVTAGGVTAVVEMAQASGLYRVPAGERNPMNTTSYGTGELLVAAAEMGATRIILGIGGSATVDGGIGCCQAAGLSVLMKDGQMLSHNDPLCGRDLADVAMIKRGRGSPVDRVRISVACDVNNPLFGSRGAARVFGPQKGASASDVAWFDEQLEALARRSNAMEAAMHPGAGAAGGMGFAMLAFFNAELVPGFQLIADAVKLRDRLRGADLVLTGEGKLDESSLAGKTPVGVARMCREMNIPCVAVAGRIDVGEAAIHAAGFAEAIAVTPEGMSMEQGVKQSAELLRKAAADIVARRSGRLDATAATNLKR